jgi:transposase-like protein
MPLSLALGPDASPRERSSAARRATRWARFERERLIVGYLNRGLSVAEIARRLGVAEKSMRALVKDILARRRPAPPEEFAALQMSRLNGALLVAYSAMSPDNLRAVGLVVSIVRELDRYHDFVHAGRGYAPPRVAPDGRDRNCRPVA